MVDDVHLRKPTRKTTYKRYSTLDVQWRVVGLARSSQDEIGKLLKLLQSVAWVAAQTENFGRRISASIRELRTALPSAIEIILQGG